MARLHKELTLFDVYAISTGAMFSSGFFLLPGIAAAQTGSSLPLAYLLAAVLILPAMFSMAELATAMPRAGGAYYFLDRSMGPLVGTIGGLGTWLALILKSAFALLGMGAYLVIFFDVPIKPLAVALTVVFAVVNVFGAKESSGLQRLLVVVLVGIMAFFLAQGAFYVLQGDQLGVSLTRLKEEPFLAGGLDGLFATAGLVFVSYAGLTKVASVAEEVKDPDRNIPLGMFLSLLTATVVYVLGVALMGAVLPIEAFHKDLTPVATAGETIFTWVPKTVGLALVVASAIAAFASTGNAGIMSSSRYPLAMARDKLLPKPFARLSKRFHTPVLGIVATAAVMIALIVAFDITAVAKLASAFQLMLFGMVSLAVIVMRESRIAYYQPGYRSPLYPWLHIAGMIIPAWLITEMGWLAILFTAGVIVLCVAWYLLYARDRVERGGAIYHVFERLGREVWRGLDDELRTIMAEKGLTEEDPLEELVTGAEIIRLAEPASYEDAIDLASLSLGVHFPTLDAATIAERLREKQRLGLVPVTHQAALPHLLLPNVARCQLILMHAPNGIRIKRVGKKGHDTVNALILLTGPDDDAGRHLRILAHIASRVEREGFAKEWCSHHREAKLKEALLREERFHRLRLRRGTRCGDQLIGRRIVDAGLPRGIMIALIQRQSGSVRVPQASDLLAEGDRLTLIGEPDILGDLLKDLGRTVEDPSPG